MNKIGKLVDHTLLPVQSAPKGEEQGMSKLVSPHGGGTLKPLLLPLAERAEALKRAERLNKVPEIGRARVGKECRL